MMFRAKSGVALLAVLGLALGGCGSDEPDETTGLTIVASTNVYGDIAQAVAGEWATVTSLITGAAQDPHEYEASAHDRLAVDQADLVIENGGGYDIFMDTLLAGSDAAVIDAVTLSGLALAEGDEGFNEHVWYDFATVGKLAAAIGDQLGQLDPDHAAAYQANAAALTAQLDGLVTAAADLRTTAQGKGVVITEPVPLYLLDAAGLINLTPEEFSEAVEEGADVPPRALLATLDLFATEDVALLAYNTQTADATTEQVRAAAEEKGVPVVDFAETLPEGQTYVEWQQANLDHLAAARTCSVVGSAVWVL
jgi:zinc/manganese transport system substrate-binding protein